MADLRQGRLDNEPALRLGGRQARCAAGCRTVLDIPFTQGSEGSPRAGSSQLLGNLEFFAEQSGGKEPIDAFVATVLGRAVCRGERRLRPAALGKAARL